MSRMEKAVDEMASYVCDKVCRYGTDVSLDQERLDDICAECEMGDHVCHILNEHIRTAKNRGRLRRKERPLEVTDVHIDEYRCPACGAENGCNDGIVTDNYCPECGQRIFQKMEAKGLEPLASR